MIPLSFDTANIYRRKVRALGRVHPSVIPGAITINKAIRFAALVLVALGAISCSDPVNHEPEGVHATASASIVGTLELRRVGHRPVQMPGLSDGPSKLGAYFGVAAFDTGEVVPLNVWYHPQLFAFHPSSGALESRAVLYPHIGTGNEDALRWRIRAHKGTTAANSFFMWTVKNYEELSSENGTLARDAGVFSSRPIESSPAILPTPSVRALNMGNDASNPNIGPDLASLDYDPVNKLAFVSMDRSDISQTGDVFQILRLNTTTGAFEGRVRVPKPSTTALQAYTFIRVDPAHRLVMLQADNYWEPHKDLLYLAQYTPTGGSDLATIQNFHQLGGFFLPGHQGDINYMPTASRDAVFAERNGRLYAILGGNGLYVFNLGPVGGPYALAAPVGKVPLNFPLESLKIVEDNLLVSTHGIELYSLNAVLGVTGEQAVPKVVYRLPYKTFDFDLATIEDNLYLFLASGQQGIDTFRLTNNGTGLMTGTINTTPRSVNLTRGPGTIQLESGGGLRYLGAPAMNSNGDLAIWGVTDNQREVIVRMPSGQNAQIIADTATGTYTSLSRPSLNDTGQVVFHAAKPDGSEAIVLHSGTRSEVANQSAGTGFLQAPEIAGNGDIVFAKGPLPTGPKQIVVRKASGQQVTVFTEDSTYTFHGGGDYGSLQGDYDIAPNGSVAFNRFTKSNADARLSLWNGSSLVDLYTDQRSVNYVRFTTNGFITTMNWANEVLRLRRTTPSGTSKSLADRHSTYQNYVFGNFFYSAAISNGDTVFAAPKYVLPTMGREITGYSLHYYSEASPNLPDTILKTTAVVDGRTVRNVDFVDAFNDAGTVTFTTELEGSNGDYRFALIRYDAFGAVPPPPPPPPASLSLATTVSTTGNCPGSEVVDVQSNASVLWCYLVTNTGGSSIANVSVNDDKLGVVPGGSFTLAAGQSRTWSRSYVATADITIIAVASGTTSPGNTPVASNQDSAAVNVVSGGGNTSIELDVTISDDGVCPGANTLAVPKNTVVVNCYAVQNTGAEALVNIVVKDGSTVIGEIADLGPGEFDLITSVPIQAINDASVSGTVTGTNSSGVTVSDSDTALLDVVPDLQLQMDAPASVTSGVCTTIPYTIKVTNTGDNSVLSPIVRDVLPTSVTFSSVTTTSGTCSFASGTVTCNLADLPAASTATIVITTVPQIASGTINNSASVTSSTPDTIVSNNVDFTDTVVLSASVPAWQKLSSSFNATPILAGGTLWFTAVMSANGLPSASTTIAASNGVISFSAGGTVYEVAVPRARVTFDSAVSTAAVSFNAAKNEWATVAPRSFKGNVFFAAVALPIASNLPGGISPITWSTNITTNQTGVSVSWAWSAAVYSTFNANYNLLNIQPIDDKRFSPYANADKAGTPELFKTFLVNGARSTGGTNYTGTLTGKGTGNPALRTCQ